MCQGIGTQTLYLMLNGCGGIDMTSQVRYAALVFLLLVSTGGQGAPPDEEQLLNQAVERLNGATRWIIEEGIHFYSQQGYKELNRKLRKEWILGLYTDPYLEEHDYLARFIIKTRGIHHNIINVYREQVGGDYYEFWIVNVTGLDWSGVSNRAEFFVTRTQAVYGTREILKQSDQFLPRYRVEGGREVVLPLDDLEILYYLSAWLFPDNYLGLDVDDMKVFLDRNGNYKRCGADIFSYLFYPCR